jgi:hypothetical protein
MNNTFDIQRFGLLLKRKWLEFGKIYLITLAVAFGVMLIAYTIAIWPLMTDLRAFSDRILFFREPLFLVFGFLFITAVASTYFSHLGQKPKTIIDLLIPASTFEKFLAGVFFTAILTTVSFVVLFLLTDLVFVAKLRSMYNSVSKTTSYTDAQGTATAIKDNVAYFFTRNKPNLFLPLYVVPFFATSIFLLGSIYFNKFHYIKTALSVMVFTGIWTFIVVKAGQFLTDGRHAVEDPGRIIHDPGKDTIEWLLTLLLLVLTIVFWAITYVRLKEKEV